MDQIKPAPKFAVVGKGVALILSAALLPSFATAEATATTQIGVLPILAQSTKIGKPAASTKLHLTFALPPINPAALEAYANAVSNPKSPLFHRFLTPAQVGAKFGQPDKVVNAFVTYLKGKGLTVKSIAPSHLAIRVDGTVSATEKALSTTFATYRATGPDVKGNSTFFAYTTAPKLPVSLTKVVQAIGGIESYTKPKPRDLTVNQARTLYNVQPFTDNGRFGEGVNVAIVNWDGYRLSNLAPFYSTYGLATPSGGVGSNVHKISINGVNGESVSAAGEGDLDIQMVLGMAPKADLYIYDNGGDSDVIAVLTQVANDDTADIVSESWGWALPESTADALHTLHQQMTVQGITYLAASGDNGTDDLGFSYPNYDPEVLQVGGTVASVDGTGARASENGWDGSGGGWTDNSISFNVRPPYQADLPVKPGVDKRLFPDVAGNAVAYDFFSNGILGPGDGTSFASPIFAGQLAIATEELRNQGALDSSPSGRARLGRLHDQIYSWAGRSDVFFDVTSGDTGPLPDGTESTGAVGWDFVTGWGAVDLQGFVNALLENGSEAVDVAANGARITTITSPNRTLGTSASGSAADLQAQDGNVFSVKSVSQVALGQVASSTLDFQLTGNQAFWRSATAKLFVSAPRLTTNFVYALNYQTGDYDLISTTPAVDAGTLLSIRLDPDKYVSPSGQISLMNRVVAPSRLRNTQFTSSVDAASIEIRVPRS